MLENLRLIQSNPDYYIDIKGNVYNKDLKVLKHYYQKTGMPIVVLPRPLNEKDGKSKTKTYLISRLLLEHFVRKPKCNEIAINIDGNKSNYDISNLEWRINNHHFNPNNDEMYNKGESNPSSKLNEKDVLDIKKKVSQGILQRDIAKEYGISQSTVSAIKNAYKWPHLNNMTQDIGIKCLYTFSCYVFNARLDGMFVAARVDVKNAIGETITIGKDVIELAEHMFNELAVSDLVIESLLEASNNKFNPFTLVGYNPLEYIKEQQNE